MSFTLHLSLFPVNLLSTQELKQRNKHKITKSTNIMNGKYHLWSLLFYAYLKKMTFLSEDKNQHCIHFAKSCVVPEWARVMLFVFFCNDKSSFIPRNTEPASKHFSHLKLCSKVKCTLPDKMAEQKTFK